MSNPIVRKWMFCPVEEYGSMIIQRWDNGVKIKSKVYSISTGPDFQRYQRLARLLRTIMDIKTS